MANRSEQDPHQRIRHLDASGPRDVVYCHQCTHEWYHDQFGLDCPHCDGGITEIIIPGDDDPRQLPLTSPSTSSRRNNDLNEDISDSQDSDSEGHSTYRPNTSVLSNHTSTSASSRQPTQIPDNSEDPDRNHTDHVLRDFHSMISSLIGVPLRNDAPSRSGIDTHQNQPGIRTSTFRFGGNHGTLTGGRITFTSTFNPGPFRSRNTNENHIGEAPPAFDLVSLIENIMAPMGENTANPHGGQVGIPGLFSAILFPSNARAGDAVYSQEAFDQIISALMEQSPTSNAPGPASPEAIAALPKKKLDADLLGSDEKGECSICMDDISIGQEVVILPCNHWFDETCVKSWLKEHNTCPICRKGINEENSSSNSSNSRRSNANASAPRNGHSVIRLSSTSPRASRNHRLRNEERLNYLRNAAGANLSDGAEPENLVNRMPGSFHGRSLDTTDIRNEAVPERPQHIRHSSTSGNTGSSGGNTALNWIRGIQDRLSNNRRNE